MAGILGVHQGGTGRIAVVHKVLCFWLSMILDNIKQFHAVIRIRITETSTELKGITVITLTFWVIVWPKSWDIDCLDFAITLTDSCHTFNWHCNKGKWSFMPVLKRGSKFVLLGAFANKDLVACLQVALSHPLYFPSREGFFLLFLSPLNVAKNLKDQYTEFSIP